MLHLLSFPESLLAEILRLLLTGHQTLLEEHDALDDLSSAAISCRALRAQANTIFDERLAGSTDQQRAIASSWSLAGFRLLQICNDGSSYSGELTHTRALICPHIDWLRAGGAGGCGMMEHSTLITQKGGMFPVLFEWNRVGRAHEATTWTPSKSPVVMVGTTLTYLNGKQFSLAVLGTLQQWMPDVATAFGGMTRLRSIGEALLRKHANNVDMASIDLGYMASERGCVLWRPTKRHRQYVACTGECTVPSR